METHGFTISKEGEAGSIYWQGDGFYFASELRHLKEAMKSKCQGKLMAGMSLLQDNTPIHSAQVTVAELANHGFELLPQPLYSQNLAPSDFFLFPILKILPEWSPFWK